MTPSSTGRHRLVLVLGALVSTSILLGAGYLAGRGDGAGGHATATPPTVTATRHVTGDAGGPGSAPPSRTPDSSTPTRTATGTPSTPLASLPVVRLRRVLDACLAGLLAFRAPSPMVEGEARDVVVNLGQRGGVEPPDANLPGRGPVQTRDVKACRHMSASLDGIGFSVARLGDQRDDRILGEDNLASWAWSVTPRASGDRTLQLQIFAIVDGLDAPVLVRTYTEEIRVQVNRAYQVQNLLKSWWPLTGLTIPVVVAGVFGAVQRRRRRNEPPEDRVVDVRVEVTGDGAEARKPPKQRSRRR